MFLVLTLLLALQIPLSILDARINGYRKHLTSTNLTVSERRTLTGSLNFHIRERYKVLEQVEEDG